MVIAGIRDCGAPFVSGLLVCLALGSVRTSLSAAESQVGSRKHLTKHFVIRSGGTSADLQNLGERCESLLAELKASWFEDSASAGGWTPRCELVIHNDAPSYLRNVPGGDRTVGSSWIETAQGRVITRRIDVRGDREDWFDGALPHELMHVLLADHFVDVPMPLWAEEGLALLVDPDAKQARHDFDFRRAAAGRSQFRLVELFAAAGYPSATRQLTFYGQSASLVRYLAGRGRPADFIAFVERSSVEGYDAALRTSYGIDGVSALEAAWLRSVDSSDLAVVK